MESRVYTGKSPGGTLPGVNRRQTQKRMRLLLEKSRRDFTLGKVKKGKNSPAFCSARKVRAGFRSGKQATNSRKVTFTARRVPTGFRSGKQATNSKKALFGTRRVRAGLYPIYGGVIWAFIRVILRYAGAGLSHEACDGFAVIQGEIPTHFLPGFVARDSDTRSDAISDAE